MYPYSAIALTERSAAIRRVEMASMPLVSARFRAVWTIRSRESAGLTVRERSGRSQIRLAVRSGTDGSAESWVTFFLIAASIANIRCIGNLQCKEREIFSRCLTTLPPEAPVLAQAQKGDRSRHG